MRNLRDIRNYIAQFAPLGAERFTRKLVASVETLANSPDRGRPVGAGLRELVVISPYIVRYRVKDDAVEVIRIRHGAREPD